MKRITILFAVFLGIYLYRTQPVPEMGPEIDTIKLKMSATKRLPATPVIHSEPEVAQSEAYQDDSQSSEEDQSFVSTTEEDDHVEHLQEAPWDEMKEGWKTSLKEFLSEADPERGEEIYNLYLEELSQYESEMAALTKEGEASMDEDSLGNDVNGLLGQLETKHEDKLKEILGPHYMGVTEHHQNYNNSLQYMNRGPSEVGVPL